jgi:hypothetical protein
MLNSPVSSLLRKATRKQGEPLNVLTFPTHERYETNLCETGHNFFAYWKEGIKKWNNKYAQVPQNYQILDFRYGTSKVPLHLDFDFILSQNKFGQYQAAQQIAQQLHLPIVSLEHTLPMPNWTVNNLQEMSGMRGDINVFISDYSIEQWWFDRTDDVRVIKHCVDTDIFCEKDVEKGRYLLSVVNDWINRDWCCGFKLWTEIVQDSLPVRVIGDTRSLSVPARDVNELVSIYQNSLIFLNTSLVSPVPSALLEAMSCGCAIVSTATCMIPEIIEHGVNGYISNNPDTLREYCTELLNEPDKAIKMGKAARETILNRFNKERFLNEWNDIFYEAANINYIGHK